MNLLNGDLQKLAKTNENYREVIYTNENFQVILQSLNKDEDVPEETHENSTQFIYCVQGTGVVYKKGEPFLIKENGFVIVPPKTNHYIKSTSEKFKFYTIYNSKEHDPNLIEIRQPNKYSIGEEFILFRNKNSGKWNFGYKYNEKKLCNHEFSNIKNLSKEVKENFNNPCPLCQKNKF